MVTICRISLSLCQTMAMTLIFHIFGDFFHCVESFECEPRYYCHVHGTGTQVCLQQTNFFPLDLCFTWNSSYNLYQRLTFSLCLYSVDRYCDALQCINKWRRKNEERKKKKLEKQIRRFLRCKQLIRTTQPPRIVYLFMNNNLQWAQERRATGQTREKCVTHWIDFARCA